MKAKVLFPLFIFSSVTLISQTWSPVGNGNNVSGPTANVWMAKSDPATGIMYFGGCYDSVNGMASHHIAQWDMITFSAMGTGVNGGNTSAVLTSEIYNGDLYAGGSFTQADGVPASNIARWNGTSWDSVGSGVNGWIWTMKVFNGELYVGGYFTIAGGVPVNSIAKWNGTSWSGVALPLVGGCYGMEVYNNQLFVHAWDVYAFNGNTWISTNAHADNNMLGEAGWRGMAVYNGELYVGGLDSAGGFPVAGIAKWNGSNWSAVGSGLISNVCGACASVCAMKVYNGELYVGGRFTQAGGYPADNIAKWNGQNWSALGSGTDDVVVTMDTINNTLFVGGYFSLAGGNPAYRIALWNTPTGIEDPAAGNVQLFQHNTSAEITLHGNFPDGSQFEVYNMMGQRVYYSELPAGNSSQTLQLPVADGAYVYSVHAPGTNLKTGKLLVVR